MIMGMLDLAEGEKDQFRQAVKESRAGAEPDEKLHVRMTVADGLIGAFENVNAPNEGGERQKHLKNAVGDVVLGMREEVPLYQEENDGAKYGENEKHVLYDRAFLLLNWIFY